MDWFKHPYPVILLGALIWLGSGVAGAYPTPVDFDGSLLRWDVGRDGGPIYYEIKGDVNDVFDYEAVIEEAAGMWADVQTSYVAYASLDQAPEGTKAHVTLHLERDFEGVSSSSGYARFDEVTDSGKPRHCEIKVAMGVNGIPKTILHELGHCLGLGHSLVPEAIMSYRDEKNGFYLDTDDQAAVSRLYPVNGETPKLPPGCAIGTGHSPAAVVLLLAGLAPLLIGLLKRPRARI